MNVLRQRLDDLALTYHGEILDAVARTLDTETAFQWRVQSRPNHQTPAPSARPGVGHSAAHSAHSAQGNPAEPNARRARLYLAADAIARRVAFEDRPWRASDLVATRAGRRPRTSTVHQTSTERARMQRGLQAIRVRLQAGLANALTPRSTQALEGLITAPLDQSSPFGEEWAPIARVQGELARRIGSARQRLTLAPLSGAGSGAAEARAAETRAAARQASGLQAEPVASEALFQWVKLTIELAVPSALPQQFGTAVARVAHEYAPRMPYDELLSTFAEQLASPTSTVTRVLRGFDTETLGMLKREAAFVYLRALAAPDTGYGQRLAQAYVRRLDAFRAYLAGPGGDLEYQVSVRGRVVNLRALFASADIFHRFLPVFPMMTDPLGETTNWERERRQYVYGVKLKLNGQVTRQDKLAPEARGRLSSFAYHLAILRGHGEYAPEDLLALAILYHVAFVGLQQEATQPPSTAHALDAAEDWLATLKRDVLAPLAAAPAGSASAPVPALLDLARRIEREPVNLLAQTFRTAARHTTHASQTWQGHVVALRGLVEQSADAIEQEGRLLREFDSESRQYLSYMDVRAQGTGAQLDDDVLMRLGVRITIEHLGCFQTGDASEGYEGGYAHEALCTLAHLPVLLTCAPRAVPQDLLMPTWDGLVAPGAQIHLTAPLLERHGAPGQQGSAPAYAYLQESERAKWYVYRHVFLLVSYLMLDVLAESIAPSIPSAELGSAKRRLFITLNRMHRTTTVDARPNDPESFLSQASKTLAHVLGADHLTSTQGYLYPRPNDAASKDVGENRLRNALASLYATLPKRFAAREQHVAAEISAAATLGGQKTAEARPLFPPELNRVALLAVSSQECDSLAGALRSQAERLTVVYGEITLIEQVGPREAQVARVATFSDVCSTHTLYEEPAVILDQIHRLYEAGVRHVIYLARAPYSTTLHLTRDESSALAGSTGVEPTTEREGEGKGASSDGLYFLSRAILARCTRDKPDLRIYPIFQSRYFAARLSAATGVGVFYIQDVSNLTRVIEDDTRQMVVFLNLFSGVPLPGRQDGEKYHGAVSYATLVNVYQDILNESDLRAALVPSGGRSVLKDALTHALIMFHLARYEKVERTTPLKTDPYDDIIGDQSVGRLARASHASPHVETNLLALLSAARAAVRIPPVPTAEEGVQGAS